MASLLTNINFFNAKFFLNSLTIPIGILFEKAADFTIKFFEGIWFLSIPIFHAIFSETHKCDWNDKKFWIGPIAYLLWGKNVRYFKNLTDMFCFFPRKIWENWLWQWCPLVPVSTIHSLDHFHKAMEIFLTKFYQMVQIRFHHTEHQNPVHVIGMVLRNRTTIFTVISLMMKFQKYKKIKILQWLFKGRSKQGKKINAIGAKLSLPLTKIPQYPRIYHA